MSYQQLGDLTIVQLGGTNKTTGKPNPKEVEGYLVRIEQKDNKFKPGEKQNFYILDTKNGTVGLFGKTDIDRKMKTASLGAMTKIATTNETKDTGKGFPMKVYYVAQDTGNTVGSSETSDTSDEDLFESTEIANPRDGGYPLPATGTQLAQGTSSAQQRVQALLKSRTQSK